MHSIAAPRVHNSLVWDIEAAFDALPQDNARCNKCLKPKQKHYNAFTYRAFMEINAQ